MRLVADVIGDFFHADIARKRALARPRLPFARRLDRTLIDAARELPQPRSPFSESIDELLIGESLEIADRSDAHVDEYLLGDFADARDFSDGKRDQKGLDLFGTDHEEAVRLSPIGS